MKHSTCAAENTLVSIIIPSYNQGRFIESTIRSVLGQTYRPIEIIIVDAGSSDNTLNILHNYDNFPEVRWNSEPDRGHADGVNKGLALARGDIVAWLNSDDVYFSRDVLSKVVKHFSRRPNVDVLYGDSAIISKENIILRFFLLPPYSLKRLQRMDLISQPATFFRKRVIEKEKLDTGQVGLDYEYWLRLGTLGYRFYHVRELFAGDRQYPERLSVVNKELINTQIKQVKLRHRISPVWQRVMYPFDRFIQALCRLEGVFLIARMLSKFDKWQAAFSFPAKIDSPLRVLLRQLFVGIDKLS